MVKTATLIFLALALSGCVQIIIEPDRIQYNSWLKDLSYKDFESVSNKFQADMQIEPVPEIKIKTD